MASAVGELIVTERAVDILLNTSRRTLYEAPTCYIYAMPKRRPGPGTKAGRQAPSSTRS